MLKRSAGSVAIKTFEDLLSLTLYNTDFPRDTNSRGYIKAKPLKVDVGKLSLTIVPVVHPTSSEEYVHDDYITHILGLCTNNVYVEEGLERCFRLSNVGVIECSEVKGVGQSPYREMDGLGFESEHNYIQSLARFEAFLQIPLDTLLLCYKSMSDRQLAEASYLNQLLQDSALLAQEFIDKSKNLKHSKSVTLMCGVMHLRLVKELLENPSVIPLILGNNTSCMG